MMVFPSSLRVHAALCALVALPFASATHWIFGGTRPVVTTRLDPIVSPGAVSLRPRCLCDITHAQALQVSTHVHDVFGGSAFSPNYDPNAAVNAQCTTVVIPQDKSNYWVVRYIIQRSNDVRCSSVIIPACHVLRWNRWLVHIDEYVRSIPSTIRDC